MTPRGIALALALVLSLVTAARAEDNPKELYERATAAFALQHYEEAAALYEKSFSIKPDPALLYNAAQAHRMGGNKVRALKLYQNYLKLYGTRIPNRAEVERHITQLKAAIATDEAAASAPPTLPRPVASEPQPKEAPRPEPVETRPEPAPAAAPAPAVTAQPTTVAASAPAPVDKPVWKKGWFWGAVVGAVVVVGVGVGLGVGLGTQSGPHDPSPTVGSFQAN